LVLQLAGLLHIGPITMMMPHAGHGRGQSRPRLVLYTSRDHGPVQANFYIPNLAWLQGVEQVVERNLHGNVILVAERGAGCILPRHFPPGDCANQNMQDKRSRVFRGPKCKLCVLIFWA
jgi:hypothetical protein